MISTLISKGGINYGLISGSVGCPHCSAVFPWSECRATSLNDGGDELEQEMRLFGPGCPTCKRVVPLGRFNFPPEDCLMVARQAAGQHRPNIRKAAVAGVWGQRGGLIAAMSFPWLTKNAECGKKIDEFLLAQGWPQRYGSTWIRGAVWTEAIERGGQKHERIMVHWDGKFLNWSRVVDWLMIAPEGLLDD